MHHLCWTLVGNASCCWWQYMLLFSSIIPKCILLWPIYHWMSFMSSMVTRFTHWLARLVSKLGFIFLRRLSLWHKIVTDLMNLNILLDSSNNWLSFSLLTKLWRKFLVRNIPLIPAHLLWSNSDLLNFYLHMMYIRNPDLDLLLEPWPRCHAVVGFTSRPLPLLMFWWDRIFVFLTSTDCWSWFFTILLLLELPHG